MTGSGPASTSVPQESQHLSSQVLRQCKPAHEDGKAKIMKTFEALDRRPEIPHSAYYALLAAAVCKEVARIDSLHAKGLLIEGEAEPLIGRDDGTGNSLARLKPYHERGSGKGNARNRGRAKKQGVEQENVPPAPPFIVKPTARRPRSMVQTMKQAVQKASGRMQEAPPSSLQEMLPQGAVRPPLQDAPSQQLGHAMASNLPEVSCSLSIAIASSKVISTINPHQIRAHQRIGAPGLEVLWQLWVSVDDLPELIVLCCRHLCAQCNSMDMRPHPCCQG